MLLNLDPVDNKRITDVKLADFESTVPEDSQYAKDGDPIGTAIFRSPEAHLQMQWGTPTDVWSFGTMVSIFRPSRLNRNTLIISAS